MAAGLSQAKLAELVSQKQQTIARVEKGKSYHPSILGGISLALGVREEWLLSGKNPREVAAPHDTDSLPSSVIRESRGHYLISKKVQLVPVVTWAQAGQGEIFSDPGWHIDEYRKVESSRDDLVGIIVKGDSMEPSYNEGDRVIIATDLRPHSGQAAVVKTKARETMLKIYHERAGKIVLTSRNEKYKPITLDKADILKACPVITKFEP